MMMKKRLLSPWPSIIFISFEVLVIFWPSFAVTTATTMVPNQYVKYFSQSLLTATKNAPSGETFHRFDQSIKSRKVRSPKTANLLEIPKEEAEDEEEDRDAKVYTTTTTKSPRATNTNAEREEAEKEKERILKHKGEIDIPDYYNKLHIPKFMLPGTENIPIPVLVFLNIRSISGIDEEMLLEMDILIEWADGVLLHEQIMQQAKAEYDLIEDYQPPEQTLDPVFLDKIWKPDIYIETLVDVKQPNIIVRPAKLKFSSRITYTNRVTTRIKCDLDFQYYPADTQKCRITLRSYSHNNSELMLIWRPPGIYLQDPSDDNFDIAVGNLRRFVLLTRLGDDENPEKNETYDALEFTVFARRKLSYQLLQTYIPSTLYIAITWLCFMIPSKMIEARVAIAMTTLLTLTSMFGSVRESTPVVSYVKAIDLWMVSSIAFVFLTLLEFAVLLWTEYSNENIKSRSEKGNADQSLLDEKNTFKNSKEEGMEEEIPRIAFETKEKDNGKVTFGQRLRKKVLADATIIINFVEDYSVVILFSIFIIYNIFYWSWLLHFSGYYEWNVDYTFNAQEQGYANMDANLHRQNLMEMQVGDLPVYGHPTKK